MIFFPEVIMAGRKVRDEAEAGRLLAAASRSGVPRAAWARQHGIDARSLNAWRLNLARGAKAAVLPELRLVELVPAPPTKQPAFFRLYVDDIVVEVESGFDEAELGRLLAAVRAC